MGCGASSLHDGAVMSPKPMAGIIHVSMANEGGDDGGPQQQEQQQQKTPERRSSLPILEGIRRVSNAFADSVERRFSTVGIDGEGASPGKGTKVWSRTRWPYAHTML